MTKQQPGSAPSYKNFLELVSSQGLAAAPGAQAAPSPPNFPPGIPVGQVTFENWSLAINVKNVWEATVANEDDVVTLANWASANSFTIRASGHSHNWSPLVIPNSANAKGVLLVDTSKLQDFSFDATSLTATFGVGVTVETATLLLQNQNNGNPSGAPGYSWQNFTAPGALSIGGVLAIDAHGTGLPFNGPPQPLNGTLSNLVVSFKAVVTDPSSPNPSQYEIKEFSRSDPDASAFLTHLGRAFLTEVTMKVIPNYYLEVTNSYPDAAVLFQPSTAPASAQTISSLLDQYGRVEVIWFPFTSNPWIKTWKLIPQLTQPSVPGPYNYPWANNISLTENFAIKAGLFLFPSTTPEFGKTQLGISQFFAPAGASMQGTSRDLLLYVQDTTLRVTALGYAVQLPRAQVQQAANDFYVFYSQLLTNYQNAGKFPINGPVELRWTTIDRTDELGIAGAQPPALSAARSVNPADKTLDTIFWLDALTIPGTKDSNNFYYDLEQWILKQWGTAASNVARPEWSKGWAATQQNGTWTNQQILTQTIPAAYNQPSGDNTFTWAQQTLAKYDKAHIYTNAFLDVLLPG